MRLKVAIRERRDVEIHTDIGGLTNLVTSLQLLLHTQMDQIHLLVSDDGRVRLQEDTEQETGTLAQRLIVYKKAGPADGS